LREARFEIARYGLAEDFGMKEVPSLQKGEWLLCVNYFGLCGPQVEELLARLPRRQVIVDNSHALFAPPFDCLATIYSPRKFVGAPDGGYLHAAIDVPVPLEQDEASVERCVPLLVRAGHDAESGYDAFLRTQDSLVGQPPKRMSKLTQALLGCVDYESVALRRRSNFAVLLTMLGPGPTRGLSLTGDAVPLSYPFFSAAAGLRERLIRHRVYVPRYWPQLLEGEGVPEFERYLAHECFPLPCDQRYDAADMEHIAQVIGGAGAARDRAQ
jgi:hypothetical protein